MTRAKDPKRAETEARLQQAITEYDKRQKKDPNDSKSSLRCVAKDFGIPRQTLKDRLDGKVARNKAHEQLMNLTIREETELVHWITLLTQRGYAPRYCTVRELAEIIRNRRVIGVNDDDIQLVTYNAFGRDWVARFMSRHPQLESARRKLIEAARIKDVSVERLTKWFEDLQSVINEYDIELGNLYNMDESGFAIGDVEASQRIINATIRQRFQAKPGRQEWVTAIECVCADGTSLPPLIIFKGENLSRQWIPASIHNHWRFGCNTKGWTSNVHGLQWLRQVFEVETREKANGKPRLLICDGHDSHITASWIAHCMKNNIILMVLPPHSSHLTQPLDVSVFKPLKTLMASAIEPLVSTELHRILKAEWLSAFVEAHDGAFSIQNIQSGFRGTGIMPLNPSKVIDRVKPPAPTIQESIIVRDSTPIDLTTPFKPSVLTSSPIYNEDTRSANAALLTELTTRDALSTPARTYAHCIVRREERSAVRNIIRDEEHKKLKAAVTRRKAILSGKRQIVDGKHILTTPEVHGDLVDWEENTEKSKTTGAKRGKGRASKIEQESIDESQASQDEELVILECIEVK
jgi:hypothetical protein